MTKDLPMDCHTARAGLWPPERPRLVGEAEAKARAHVAACAACTHYFAQDRAILDALSALRGVRAPLEVRERIFQAVAASRSRQSRSSVRSERARARLVPMVATMVGLTVALPAGALLLGNAWRGGATTQIAVAEDYLRRTVSEDYLDTSDPREAVRFLERELGMVLTPLQTEGLTVERVEICLLDGARGAMIRYRLNDAKVSHYIVPNGSVRGRAPAIARERPGGTGEALPMVTWATPALEQVLVGGVSPAALMELARAAAGR